MKKVAFHTLGCKLNFSETSSIARDFQSNGYRKVDFDDSPDVYVINTCSVTDHADRKCKQVVRDAKKISPDARVAVIGCYAQLRPDQIAEIPGVDLVLGAAQKFDIIEHLEKLRPSSLPLVHCSDIESVVDFKPSYSLSDRTRTFLKIQDGCDYKCSFCTIPQARGKSRSGTIDSVVQQVNEILEKGVKEIVLTGVNIGDFGKHDQGAEETFYSLIQELERIDGDHRFRISSIEPNLLTSSIIQLVANSTQFVPHFHIPMQSGSNRILRAMARRYDRELYRDRIQSIRTQMAAACIGVDVIVGFPGEDETAFTETMTFLKELDISYLHVFTYSERPNTKAIALPGSVANSTRTQRSQMLRLLSQKKRRRFYEKNLGQTRTVLFEDRPEQDLMQGFTDNYVKVQAGYDTNCINRLVEVQLDRFNSSGAIEVRALHEQLP